MEQARFGLGWGGHINTPPHAKTKKMLRTCAPPPNVGRVEIPCAASIINMPWDRSAIASSSVGAHAGVWRRPRRLGVDVWRVAIVHHTTMPKLHFRCPAQRLPPLCTDKYCVSGETWQHGAVRLGRRTPVSLNMVRETPVPPSSE